MILGPQDKTFGITGLTMASRKINYYIPFKWGRELVLVLIKIRFCEYFKISFSIKKKNN